MTDNANSNYPASAEWSSLQEAKSACDILSSSPVHLNSLTHLTLVSAIGLDGRDPNPSESTDIAFILSTIASLPNLNTLTLNDSPYNWIPDSLLPSSNLHTLVSHDPDEDLVSRLLPSQPTIRSIEFWSFQSPMEWDAPALADVLPQLESVAGYPAAIQHFVPGRPVHTIRASMITNVAPVAYILAAAKQSTVPVTTLDIAVLEEERESAASEIIQALGASLRSLTVRYHSGSKIDSAEAFHTLQDDWTAALSKAGALESFTPLMWFSKDDVRPDGSVVAAHLGYACQTLQAVRLCGRQWKRGADAWAVDS